jgi:hypothetical protein
VQERCEIGMRNDVSLCDVKMIEGYIYIDGGGGSGFKISKLKSHIFKNNFRVLEEAQLEFLGR